MALLGPGVGQLMFVIAPDFTEGVGRGFKKGADGTKRFEKRSAVWIKCDQRLGLERKD